jgi:hypothetical protein
MKELDSNTLGWNLSLKEVDWRASLRTATAGCRRWGLKAIEAGVGPVNDLIALNLSDSDKRAEAPNGSSVLPDRFVTLDQLKRLCREESIAYLVEGLLPAADVHIAVGDSGLGKTPWAYQLGLCVATGKPFLGHDVRQGRVLYFDFENGREEILGVCQSICGYLGIKSPPTDFLVLQDNGNPPRPVDAIADNKPVLVIVDTLRAFHPDAEGKNAESGRFLGELRRTARSANCAILLLHHIRKRKADEIKALEDTPTLEWLEHASGARALINQTNTRIAFDKPGRGGDDAAFVMKYFVKLKGESGPLYLERVCNDGGEPIGYQSIVGVHLLGNARQEEAFERLPDQFRFRDAVRIYERSDDPTKKWLDKCIAANLLRQVDGGATKE